MVTNNRNPRSLDVIYYSAPIPRNMAVLTVLGVVFDKVHFPGVHIPVDGYDVIGLEKEIKRIRDEAPATLQDAELLGILNFVPHARTLAGFCDFNANFDEIFGTERVVPENFVNELYVAIHGPHPPGWTPLFETASTKGLPGGQEEITYRGRYHYLAGALIHSAKSGIPILNDTAGLPIPGLEPGVPVNDATMLSTLLAIERTKVVLPNVPLLHPNDLMEFRAENAEALRLFRRSMLRYAADLNDKIGGLTLEQFEEKTRFFVDTEIVPSLDELRDAINRPARSWFSRAIDSISIIPEIAASSFTMGRNAAIANALLKYAPLFVTELKARQEHREAAKRSGLHYLMKLESFRSRR